MTNTPVSFNAIAATFYRGISYFLLLVAFVFSAGKTLADELVVQVGLNQFPASYQENGEWSGMDVEILRAVFEKAAVPYALVDRPFPRSLAQARAGTLHLIPNLVKNDARSEYLDWLGPVRTTCIGLVVRSEDLNTEIKSTDQLFALSKASGKKIGYLTGASYSPYLDAKISSDAAFKSQLHFLPDNERHKDMLKLGRLYGYFFDAFEINQRLKHRSFAIDYEGLALHDFRVEESCTGAYIGISKKLDKALSEKIILAYQAIQDDGTYQAIYNKWLPDGE